MIDMYDLPTEAELGKIINEAKEKSKGKSADLDVDTYFQFWSPKGKQGAVKMGDKTGVVKPKVDFNPGEVRIDAVWEDFLAGERAKDKKNAKPVTEVDNFGSVVLDSFAQKPSPDKLVGSVKALKRTAVKEMSGKAKVHTEELGVADFVERSKAASPNKDHLVGIVKPKEAMGKQNIPDLFDTSKKVNDVSGATTTIVKDYDGTLKATPNNVTVTSEAAKPGKGDHTGIVKPKEAMGKQNIPDLVDTSKKVNDVSGATTTIVKDYDGKLKATPNNVVVKSEAAKPGKGDHTGIVKPKEAMGKQKIPTAYKD